MTAAKQSGLKSVLGNPLFMRVRAHLPDAELAKKLAFATHPLAPMHFACLLQLQRQLDQFSGTQPRRAAAELIRQYGAYFVTQPLRLDYIGLKKRLGGVPRSRRKATKPAFVEVIGSHRATLED